jgi:predicted dehydrogenase
MKFLILGCGSIGRRHAKNLRSLGVRNLVLCDADIQKAKTLGAEIKSNLIYSDYQNAIKQNPDIRAAVICTPTSFHIAPSIYFAKHKVDLFIEKPLSNNLIQVGSLSKIALKNKLVVMMGHSYLFELGFKKLKSLLDKKIIGDVYYATYLQGQYLPDWHPWANYRTEYTARKDLGGGALLTLTSHSFYIIEWLFGKISSINGSIIEKIGPLAVQVDDSVFILMKTENGIIVQSQNNFIVRIHNHKLTIEGSKGRLEYDFVNQQIKLLIHNKKLKIIKTKSDNNDRFLNEMRYFLNALKTRSIDHNLSLESGIRFLTVAKKLKG